MELKVLVIKDEEGKLRPMAGIWPAEGTLGKAYQEEWEYKLSGKKEFQGCQLVKATLKED